MSGLLLAAVGVTFVFAWIIGFITGHSRGKVEAYEEDRERANAE